MKILGIYRERWAIDLRNIQSKVIESHYAKRQVVSFSQSQPLELKGKDRPFENIDSWEKQRIL